MTVGRIPVIEGGIQPTIFDAKADLLTATANDTPARLAVGANNTLLIADSAEVTGLKWGGGWTTWTPTWVNLTVGNGTLTARYNQIGKTVNFELRFVMGSTSSMGSLPNFTLPVSSNIDKGSFNLTLEDVGVGAFFGVADIFGGVCYPLVFNAAGTYVTNSYFTATVPMTWTTSDSFMIRGSYEAA
jgi:hypothetical protein